MKKTAAIFLFLLLLVTSINVVHAQPCTPPQVLTTTPHAPEWYNVHLSWTLPEGASTVSASTTTIVDNSQLITATGVGYNDADVSAYLSTQTPSKNCKANNYTVADEFALTQETVLSSLEFYIYVAAATVPSDITETYVTIYSGDPSAGGIAIWGSSTTNCLEEVTATGIYQVVTTNLKSNARPLMKVKANLSNLSLSPGAYWFEIAIKNTSGNPYVVAAMNPDNKTKEGKAKTYTVSSKTWANWLSAAKGVTMAFSIYGKTVETNVTGYNLYRDNVKLNTTPLTSRSYLDLTPGQGIYTYGVTAVYSTCESTPNTRAVNMETWECDIPVATFPYIEGFETTTSTFLPACWKLDMDDKAIEWQSATANLGAPGSTPDGSSRKMRFMPNSLMTKVGGRTKLIMPLTNISSLQRPTLSFYRAQPLSGAKMDTLRIYYKTANEAEWVLLKEYFNSTPASGDGQWSYETLLLPSPSANYQIAFEGAIGNGNGVSIDVVELKAGEACSPAENFTATIQNNNKVLLSWAAPSDGTPSSYSLYKNGSSLTTITSTSYTDSDLSPGSYNYCVKAVYTTCESENVCREVTITDVSICAAPSNLSSTVVGKRVSLTWSAPSGDISTLEGYNVYRNGTLQETVTNTTFIQEDVPIGTHEYCITAAYSNTCESSNICNSIAIAESSTCAAPQNLFVSQHMPEWYKIRFSWDVPVGGNTQGNGMPAYGQNETPQQAPGDASDYIIFDNGPFVTHVGVGAGNADVSMLAPDGNSTGVNFKQGSLYTVTDDFTLTAENTQISTIDFFGFMTGSSTVTSPFDGIFVRIYNGDPSQGGEIIWGDFETNLFSSSSFTGVYRSTIYTGYSNRTQPIMKITANIGTSLPAGTYWVEVVTTGDFRYGTPWAIPVTIDGQIHTGNAIRNTMYYGWEKWVDYDPNIGLGNRGRLGLPFVIHGTEEGVRVVGYNIYRDGTKLNQAPLTDRFYFDTAPGAGSYYYGVQAVWSNGCESDIAEIPVEMLPDPCTENATIQFREIFDNDIPFCWTNTSPDGNVWRYKAKGDEPVCMPHSGSGMVQFYCDRYPVGKTALLITPPLAVEKKSHILSFWLYRDDSRERITNTDKVNIYLSGDKTITGLTPVFTVHRSTALEPVVTEAGWHEYQVTLDCSSLDLAYVIFEGVSSNGFNIYMDDISVGDRCPMITNLKHSITNSNTINLSWDASSESNAAFTGYNVYRNGVVVASNITTTTYTDAGLADGGYDYCVTAVYNNLCGESDNVCLPEPIYITQTCGPKPLSLSYTTHQPEWYNVNLNWDGADGKWMQYADEAVAGVGTGYTTAFSIAVRWDSGDLGDMVGKYLTEVKFVPFEPRCEYTLRIHTGGSELIPGPVVKEIPLNTDDLIIKTWNRIALSEPILIEPGKDLWIEVYCNTKTGYPGGCSMVASFYAPQRSNLVSWDGTTWAEFGNPVYNWCIGGFIAENATPGSVVGYNIFRDGIQLNEFIVKDREYLDVAPGPGTYTYGVSAIWDNACESLPLETEVLMDISPCEVPITVYPYNNGFETGLFEMCWTQEFVAKTTEWVVSPGTSTLGFPGTAHDGLYKAKLYYNSATGGGTGAVTKLIMPVFDISALENPTLSFWHTQRRKGDMNDVLKVYYKTANDGAWTLLAEYPNEVFDWTKEVLSLPSPSSNYWIAFEGTINNGSAIMLDDIQVAPIFTITATAGVNGTITPFGSVFVNYDEDQTFTISPDAGYRIKDVLIDGINNEDAVSSGSYTFVNVTANHSISATFEEIPIFTITATAGANGTIAPNGATTLTYGETQEYTITANEGYKIKSVLVDDVAETAAVGASSYSYTFSNVTANHTISAEFEQITYTITATAGANGSISPAGTTTVSYGSNQAYTITANNDYLIKEVKVDGVAESAAVGKTTYNYTFNNVKANHTISATFEIANPELTGITVNNQPQTISSAMDYMAACGEQSVSMTLTAVGEVKVNGAAYTNGSPISLTGDKTVITITVTAGSNTATYTLTVAKALGSTTPLYIERWGATIAIVNNPANNGGYTFDQIQWYKASDNTPAGTGAYVVGNLNTHYADVHTPATNAWHHTCKVKATAAPAQIVVYPNPVLSGQTLNVNLPEGLNEVNIDVYDINGKLVKQHPRVTTTLTAPTGTGIYVLKIQLPDGSITTEKIVVK